MSRTTYNGNDLDRSIPYTPEHYTVITDADYPVPVAWVDDKLVYRGEKV
jgi:hypothetical protein